jgi:hypothetical protein
MTRRPMTWLLVMALLVGAPAVWATPLARFFERPSKAGIAFLLGVEPPADSQIQTVSAAEAAKLRQPELDALQKPSVRALHAAWQRYGFLPKDVDMAAELAEFHKGAVAGFYLPDTRRLYVVEDFSVLGLMNGLTEPVTVAHELAHAAQDSVMGMHQAEQQLASEEDQDNAYSMAIEGQALWVGLRVGLPMLVPPTGPVALLLAEPAALTMVGKPGELQATLSGTLLTRKVVPYIRDLSFTRYALGGEFAWVVESAWGRAGHLAIMCRTPRSTEHILHPEKWMQKVDPPRDMVVLSRGGAEPTVRTGMGEWSLRWLLREHLPDGQADEAAAGWGGDTLAVWPDGVMVWRLRMDTAEDHAQLLAALRAVYAKGDLTVVDHGTEVQVWNASAQVVAEESPQIAQWPEGPLPPLPRSSHPACAQVAP